MKLNKSNTIRANDEVVVDATATELLFEAEDVAELLAEVVEAPVEVSVEDENTVVFSVNGDEFTVEAEGTEELVESCTHAASTAQKWTKQGKLEDAKNADVRASRQTRVVTASKKPAGKVIRKVPTRR